MTQHVFKRTEEKYLLSRHEYQRVLQALQPHITPDAYGASAIYSIYFDTEHNDLIIASLDKPDYKYKLRVRGYSGSDTVFFEIKSKLDGVVYKRRVSLTGAQYEQFVAGELELDNQVAREIRHLLSELQLAPKVFIGYDRTAYVGRDDASVRITFDANLRSRGTDLSLRDSPESVPYFDNGQVIMEVKVAGGMPLWLVATLSEHQIYPASFSKYGKIYQRGAAEMRSLYA